MPPSIRSFLLTVCVLTFSLSLWATENSQKAAQTALDKLFTAYSEEQLPSIEKMVDPVMIGYQQLMDSIKSSIAKQKQIKISLHDTQYVNGKNLVVIRTGWEKRYLLSPALTPAKSTGQTVFMMQLIKNDWKLAAQSGDNIFAL